MAYDNVHLVAAAAAAASVLFSLGYFVWKLFPEPLPGLPHIAESKWRIFGDAPAVKGMGRITREPNLAFFSLNRKLGSPIVQMLLPSLSPPFIVVDDPREVEDILLRRNKEFDRSEITAMLFQQILPHATLAQTTTPALKSQKRLWSDAMNPDFLRRAVAPNIQIAARELVELWMAKVERAAGEPFDVLRDFHDTALDAIWVAILGSKAGVLRHEISKLRAGGGENELDAETLHTIEAVRFTVEEGNRILDAGILSLWPSLTYFWMKFTPTYRRFKRVGNSEVQKLMGRACQRFHRLSEKSNGGGDDGTEHDTCAMDLVLRREIMTAKKAGRPAPDPTRDPAMLEELWLLLLAGHDSTSNTLSWFVKLMALYRGAQEDLGRAVRAAFDSRFPTAAAILDAHIPVLDATIEETLRCAATAACTTRRAHVDTELLGRRIPAGTNVMLNLRIRCSPHEVDETSRSATSRAAQTKRARGGFDGESGRDLDLFEPRRWLSKDADGKEVFDAYSLPSLTFGGGFRGCFGKLSLPSPASSLISLWRRGVVLTGLSRKTVGHAGTSNHHHHANAQF